MMMAAQITIIVLFLVLAVPAFFARNLPQVGGKIGPVQKTDAPSAPPTGFSRVYVRSMTLFVAANADPFDTLKAFLRESPKPKSVIMQIYCVSGCKTEIEIPVQVADYQRIDASEALSLLRELPDFRRVRRLHLSDERSFFDPWVRKEKGEDHFLLGHATNFSLIVMYKPDRRIERYLGVILLHEWLHLVAFASTLQFWWFKHANAIEPLTNAAPAPSSWSERTAALHEAWCNLGEKLFGYDENEAQQAALALPVHSIILWRCVERLLIKAPHKFRSTRFDELMRRSAFMHSEIASKARQVRAR